MCGEYLRLCKLLMLDADPVERGLRTYINWYVIMGKWMMQNQIVKQSLTYKSASDCHSMPLVSYDFAYAMLAQRLYCSHDCIRYIETVSDCHAFSYGSSGDRWNRRLNKMKKKIIINELFCFPRIRRTMTTNCWLRMIGGRVQWKSRHRFVAWNSFNWFLCALTASASQCQPVLNQN